MVLLKTQKVQFHYYESVAVGKKKKGHRALCMLYLLSFSSLTKEKYIKMYKNYLKVKTQGVFFSLKSKTGGIVSNGTKHPTQTQR